MNSEAAQLACLRRRSHNCDTDGDIVCVLDAPRAYLWIACEGDVTGASSISISTITISTDGVRQTIRSITRERPQ